MSNSPIISNNKIIFFVVFICTALMSSLFIYHASQKPPQPVLSADVGFIFPAPRDIQSFELAATTQQSFTQKNFYGHWTLLFFGFTHCSAICPTTLDLLNRVYTNLHDSIPNLQVALISVDPARDTVSSLETYVHSYNPAFIGATGELAVLRKLQSQLGIYASQAGSNAANYQIQHTSSILLMNPKGQWAGLFKYGLKPDELINAVKTGINAKG